MALCAWHSLDCNVKRGLAEPPAQPTSASVPRASSTVHDPWRLRTVTGLDVRLTHSTCPRGSGRPTPVHVVHARQDMPHHAPSEPVIQPHEVTVFAKRFTPGHSSVWQAHRSAATGPGAAISCFCAMSTWITMRQAAFWTLTMLATLTLEHAILSPRFQVQPIDVCLEPFRNRSPSACLLFNHIF